MVLKCKNGAVGSREGGLDLTYDQFLITLFLKGLREADREKIQSKYMNYNATYQEMEEVAKSLEQSTVSLKAKPKNKGMINAVTKTKKPTCTKCKRNTHQTSECKSPKCTYCGNYFHTQEQCWANPQAAGFKGEDYARNFWTKTGRKPPTATAAATGGLLALPAPSPDPTTTGGVIAVAAIKNGALVQSMPTPRIKAVESGSGKTITLLPDSGATLNIACRASAEAWGLDIEELVPGEASLTDVQGGQIPLLGKAKMALKLPSRNLETTVSLVVADTLGLPELIIGWMDLQRWGILRLEEGEVSGDVSNGVFAVTSAAQQFLNTQTVYPPRRSFQEIDPCDPNYIQKMEVACSLLREQLISDVPLAFSDKLEPQNVVNFPLSESLCVMECLQ